MIPGTGFFVLGRAHISHLMKMHYFYKNKKSSSLVLGIDQTNYSKYIVMMTNEEST